MVVILFSVSHMEVKFYQIYHRRESGPKSRFSLQDIRCPCKIFGVVILNLERDRIFQLLANTFTQLLKEGCELSLKIASR